MNSSQSFTVISLCIFDIVYLSIRKLFSGNTSAIKRTGKSKLYNYLNACLHCVLWVD